MSTSMIQATRELQRIAQDQNYESIEELLDTCHSRVVSQLETALVPSRESFDRILPYFEYNDNIMYEYMNMYDTPDFEVLLDQFKQGEVRSEEYLYIARDIWRDLLTAAEEGDHTIQENLIDLLDFYHAEYDEELEGIVAVANDLSVNTGYSGGIIYYGLRYTLYLEGEILGDNLFADGTLVIPEVIVAIWDGKKDRFLTRAEMDAIEWDARGVTPIIRM